MISAILLAQWRSMRTFRTGGLSPSTAFSWLSGFVFYGFWCFLTFGAEEFFKNRENGESFAHVLSPGLLLVLLYWQITPIITASMGGSIDLKKLLAYPIPHRKLFAIELLLRVTTCLEMPILLLGTVIGLLRNPDLGGVRNAPGILVTVLAFIALNILLTAAFRNLLERLLRIKRTKELLMFVVVAVSVLPQFLIAKHVRPTDFGKWLPDSPYLPWSAASHILLRTGFAIPALTIAVVLTAAYFFARSQFERSLRFDGESGQRACRQFTASALGGLIQVACPRSSPTLLPQLSKKNCVPLCARRSFALSSSWRRHSALCFIFRRASPTGRTPSSRRT